MKTIDNRKRIAFDLDGTITTKAQFPEIWNLTSKELAKEYNKVKADKTDDKAITPEDIKLWSKIL